MKKNFWKIYPNYFDIIKFVLSLQRHYCQVLYKRNLIWIKKTFSGGITFALVVSLSIVTSGCSSNIDEPTFNAEMQNSSASNSISTTNSQLRGVINHKIDSINPLALEYVDNAKTLLYATDALDNRSAKLSLLTNISSYERFDESEETSKINVSSWYSPLSLQVNF